MKLIKATKLCFTENKANVKSRFEALVIFALSGETIERANWLI